MYGGLRRVDAERHALLQVEGDRGGVAGAVADREILADGQLEVAAAYYNRELETKLERATALFEPAIIIFMGVVVGFVAVALISAMYGIYNQVKVS